MSRRWIAIAATCAVAAAAQAEAGPRQTLAKPWAAARKPSVGSARAIGGYSAGCIAGAAQLPARGKGYQIVEPGRRRNFGHPDLIAFLSEFAASTKRAGHGVLMIGDLGQPRGGPTPSGHSSHQSGLDADIWYWHPKRAEKRALSRKQLKKLHPSSIVDAKRRTKTWSSKVPAVLKLAASDSRVSRIFVNPVIKRELCQSVPAEDRAWLAKIRPWWGHAAHFHVRLECPAGSPDCEAQKPIPEGDGCAELDWWLDEKAQAERAKEQQRYRGTVRGVPELPGACADLVGGKTAKR